MCRHHTPAYPAYFEILKLHPAAPPIWGIRLEGKSQSYVILIEFEWNGLKVSEVDSLENRKFLEESHLNL